MLNDTEEPSFDTDGMLDYYGDAHPDYLDAWSCAFQPRFFKDLRKGDFGSRFDKGMMSRVECSSGPESAFMLAHLDKVAYRRPFIFFKQDDYGGNDAGYLGNTELHYGPVVGNDWPTGVRFDAPDGKEYFTVKDLVVAIARFGGAPGMRGDDFFNGLKRVGNQTFVVQFTQ